MVDCGGSLCAGCPVGGSCAADADCESGAECASNVCIALPTSSPTPSPTALACNDVSCNKHGRCTNDGTCDCYKGFKGQFCEVVEKTEKNRHVEVDVYWGVSGIDRAAADGDFEAGKPVFDQSFQVRRSDLCDKTGPTRSSFASMLVTGFYLYPPPLSPPSPLSQLTGEAQLFLKDSCALFRSANSTLVTFPEGSDWVCMFEVRERSEPSHQPEPCSHCACWLIYSLTLAGSRLVARLLHRQRPAAGGGRLVHEDRGHWRRHWGRLSQRELCAGEAEAN